MRALLLAAGLACVPAQQPELLADDGTHGLELWVSDGTAAGTTRVADIRPGPNPGVVIDQYRRGPLTALGGSVFFVAAGRQLAVQAAVGPTANLPLPVDLSNGVLLTFGR